MDLTLLRESPTHNTEYNLLLASCLIAKVLSTNLIPTRKRTFFKNIPKNKNNHYFQLKF